MKPKSLMLLLVAGGCGLVAAFAVTQHLAGNQPAPPPQEPRKTVVVAVKQQEAGTILKPEMVKLIELPTNAVPEGSCTSPEQVTGETLRVPIFPGEVVIEAKLHGENTIAALVNKLPPGTVAGTASMKKADAPNAGIKPGDHVDVLWIPGSPVSRSLTQSPPELVLQNVEVLAVDGKISADASDASSSSSSSAEQNFTLLLTPKQNRRLITAGESGKIRLQLRSKADNDSLPAEEIDDARFQMLMGLRAVEVADANRLPKSDAFEIQFIRGSEVSGDRSETAPPARKPAAGRQ